jgi:hypothetical protein
MLCKNCDIYGTSKTGYTKGGCLREVPLLTMDFYFRMPNFSWNFLGGLRKAVGTASVSNLSGLIRIYTSTPTAILIYVRGAVLT